MWKLPLSALNRVNIGYENLVSYLYHPTDPSSLGIIRCLFGFLMTIDIIEERGGSEIDIRYGYRDICHFPLFPGLKPLPYPFMCLIYALMWIGALGIMLGFKFKKSSILFVVPYWYLLLLDKSFWNNHSYLYGLIGILLMGSSAENFFSLDSLLNKTIRSRPIPYWNYFILKYQFFILYFLAGLKKLDSEWLEGYAMTNLGKHWVFSPFSFILSTEQIDYLIVHLFGFFLDLTVGFWMILESTRPVAMIICAMFHLMNSRLFSIGMFPYVCLATLPLFCEEDWPRKIFLKQIGHKANEKKQKFKVTAKKVTFKEKFVVFLLLSHMGIQLFLPYSHFITKGLNNWTNGLYGYSWDMMVHSWETLVVVKIVDNISGEQHFIKNNLWTYNERWTKHADMCLQYAHCIEKNLNHYFGNISVYIDVWSSLNKRFQQRMYDPNYDLLRASWSVFQPVEWLLPVLTKYNGFRKKILEISQDVRSWNNQSDVMFVADFPGMFLDNYIDEDLSNVTLTLIEGEVVFEIENPVTMQSVGVKLQQGDSIEVPENHQHRVHTVSNTPSCYMYTFLKSHESNKDNEKMYSAIPVFEDFSARLEALTTMFGLIKNATLNLLFGHTIYVRPRIK